MSETDIRTLETVLSDFSDRRSNLIPILQRIQDQFRYLPEEMLRRVANKLKVPTTDVYHVATFYSCFSLTPRGKHLVQVCLGTACHVRGAPKVLDRILTDLKLPHPGTTQDLEFSVETVRCVGCCGLAPVVRVDSNAHPHLSQAKVKGLLRKYSKQTEKEPAV